MNTPETDSKATDIIGFFSCSTVPAGFARKLEHERDEALDQRDAITLRLGQTQEHLIDARKSAEQWRAVAAKYAGCTENECNRLPWETPWDSLHNFVIRSVGGWVISGEFGEEFLTEIGGTWRFPVI
jgi:hypothetical protein